MNFETNKPEYGNENTESTENIERITGAAYSIGGVVYTGVNHDAVRCKMDDECAGWDESGLPILEGFMTTKNRFVSRKEADRIAYTAKQSNGLSKGGLRSENVWFEQE